LFKEGSFDSTFGLLSCYSTLGGSPTPVTAFTLTNGVFDNISGPYTTDTGAKVFSIISSLPPLIQAFSVQVRYQASDLPSVVSSTSSGTGSGNSNGGGGSSESGGAIAGIVIGTLIGTAMLVALVVLLLRRRRLHQKDAFTSSEKRESGVTGEQTTQWTGEHINGEQYYPGYKAELADTPSSVVYLPVEMEGSAVNVGGGTAQELDSTHIQSHASWVPVDLDITSTATVGEAAYGSHLSGETIFLSHAGSSPQPSSHEFPSSLLPPSAPQISYSPQTHYSPPVLYTPPLSSPIPPHMTTPEVESSAAAGPSSITDYPRAQSRSSTGSQESVLAMQKRLQRVKEERQRLSQLHILSQEEEQLERELELRLASDNSP
jgi:hypothetical protein